MWNETPTCNAELKQNSLSPLKRFLQVSRAPLNKWLERDNQNTLMQTITTHNDCARSACYRFYRKVHCPLNVYEIHYICCSSYAGEARRDWVVQRAEQTPNRRQQYGGRAPGNFTVGGSHQFSFKPKSNNTGHKRGKRTGKHRHASHISATRT